MVAVEGRILLICLGCDEGDKSWCICREDSRGEKAGVGGMSVKALGCLAIG